MATGDRRLLKAAFSGVWRFLAWWGAMFAFLAGFGTTCPFCGQPGCPGGPASAGVLGGLFATGVFLTRWLGKRLGRESCKPAGHASKLDFDSLAGRYDRWYDAPEGALYDRLEKRAVARLLPRNGWGKELLDVGCGTGHWASFFSEHGFTIAGVDISPSMIRVARGKGIPRASFAIADAHELPFDSGRFDVAVAITTLEFVRDPEAVLWEMVRCTRRPGGLVLVGALNALAPINRRRKAAGKATYQEARFFSPRELKALLAPFGEARVTSAALVPQARWLLPLAPLTDALGRWLHLPYGALLVARVKL